MNLEIRQTRDSDAHYLVDIDRKSYEHPFDVRDWQSLAIDFPSWDMCIASVDQHHCGYSVAEDNRADGIVTVHRLGVSPQYRRRGIGSLLMHRIEYKALANHATAIEIPVPETSCRGPNDPYDVSEWLKKLGYRCTRSCEAMFTAYGKAIEGYIFGKPISQVKVIEETA